MKHLYIKRGSYIDASQSEQLAQLHTRIQLFKGSITFLLAFAPYSLGVALTPPPAANFPRALSGLLLQRLAILLMRLFPCFMGLLLYRNAGTVPAGVSSNVYRMWGWAAFNVFAKKRVCTCIYHGYRAGVGVMRGRTCFLRWRQHRFPCEQSRLPTFSTCPYACRYRWTVGRIFCVLPVLCI
jgi:hypothetical protein